MSTEYSAELRRNIVSSKKNVVFEIAESFFDFYIQEVARLTSVVTGSGTDYRLQSV